MRLIALITSALMLAACINLPDYRDDSVPLVTESSVDLSRYTGKWYEIARYPNGFEEGCEGVTAEYADLGDGKVSVSNTCHQGTPDGPVEVAKATARIVPGSNNSKLKVKFAPAWVPFAEGDYWILHLEQDYSGALIGAPNGKFLWVMGREPQMDPAMYQRITARARELGFATEPLYLTRH